jgi:hypothetical protein
MDEKGCAAWVIGKIKVIVLRSEQKKYMIRGGNRERVSPIECINITGEVLDSCMIFEGKVQMRDWWDHFACGHICYLCQRLDDG